MGDQSCDTLDLLLKRNGFPYEETPTNVRHVGFLNGLDLVKGITLNSNLYTNKESEEGSSELVPKAESSEYISRESSTDRQPARRAAKTQAARESSEESKPLRRRLVKSGAQSR